MLTENCNANCLHCFNKDIRQNKHMDTKKALILFNYLGKHIETLKIMGGEPTVHPNFDKLYEAAQNQIKHINLFTNAINNEILKIVPRINDNIVYNLACIDKNFDISKLLPQYDFNRDFEIVVSHSTDMKKILFNIDFIIKSIKNIGMDNKFKLLLTLNCVKDIFKARDELNIKWQNIVEYIYNINPKYLGFDHVIPLCFWTKESINLINKLNLKYYFHGMCTPDDAGLINSNFELLYCNQYPVKLADVFNKREDDNSIISFNRMNTLLFKSYMEKLLINLNNGLCINCKYAIVKCTGGCFMHKKSLKKISNKINPCKFQ